MPSPAERRDILAKRLAAMRHTLTEAQARGRRASRHMQALIPAATRHCCSAPLAAPSLLTYTCVSSRHQVAELADAAHGFVPADLGALCNEAALAALRRRIGAGGGGSAGAAAAVAGPAAGQGQAGLALCVTPADFAAAETRVRPSAMREVALEVPKVGGPGGPAVLKKREPGSFLHGRFRSPSELLWHVPCAVLGCGSGRTACWSCGLCSATAPARLP